MPATVIKISVKPGDAVQKGDLIVLLDDPVGMFDVAIDQRLDGSCDLLFDQTTHLEDLAGQKRDVFVVGFDDVIGRHGFWTHPNRPVM